MSQLNLGESLILNSDHSTSETKTGETWIDGKPIYRKSWDVPGSSFTKSTSSSRVLYTLTDSAGLIVSDVVVNLIKIEGYWLTTYYYQDAYRNRQLPLLGASMNSNSSAQIVSLVDYYDSLKAVFPYFQYTDGLSFYSNAIQRLYLTVYYTKTTD